MHPRIAAAFLVPVFIFILAGSASQDQEDKTEEGFVTLFNGKDLSGFKTILSAKGGGVTEENTDTFTVKDGVIHISGKPFGYLYTEKSYKNYVVRFDWKLIKTKVGETTTLVHITGEHAIWPKCVEIMGGSSSHGVLAGLNSKGNFRQQRKAAEGIKVDQWNSLEVISQDGKLTTKLNEVQVSTGKAELNEGHIGWMSGSAEYEVKNIRIKVEE